MNLENSVLELIINGSTPSEITRGLAIQRDQYYAVVKSLEGSGILAKVGELPEGAETEVCPPPEVLVFLNEMLADSGWNESESDPKLCSLRAFCARHGWLEPETDSRYTRSKWTGQAIRRVDFTHENINFTVCGYLVPRTDKKTWDRATPQWRVVSVETSIADGPVLWYCKRGMPVVSVDIRGSLMSLYTHSVGSKTPELYTKLALAVAWVNESRAVLVSSVRGE